MIVRHAGLSTAWIYWISTVAFDSVGCLVAPWVVERIESSREAAASN